MARKPRISFGGAIHHIVIRGNNQRKVFRAKRDYQMFLDFLRERKKRFNFKLYAYCLMTNHIHLLIEETSEEGNISKLMQSINVKYTFYFNKRYKRSGHIFQGRFFSALIQKENYFLEATRYIHLNPYRAGMVHKAEYHPWSSYRAYLTINGDPGGFVETSLAKDMISDREGDEVNRYKEFIEEGVELDEEKEKAIFEMRPIVGTKEFIERQGGLR